MCEWVLTAKSTASLLDQHFLSTRSFNGVNVVLDKMALNALHFLYRSGEEVSKTSCGPPYTGQDFVATGQSRYELTKSSCSVVVRGDASTMEAEQLAGSWGDSAGRCWSMPSAQCL
jgi:hypothetical protein